MGPGEVLPLRLELAAQITRAAWVYEGLFLGSTFLRMSRALLGPRRWGRGAARGSVVAGA